MSTFCLTIPHLERPSQATQVPALLDKNAISWTSIDLSPWAESYPYHPKVAVRIAHAGDAILLHYHVEEDTVAALETDNGRVWEDSCCEFFLRPDIQALDYYNIECNASGHMLIGFHHFDREGKEIMSERANTDVLTTVQRWSSLGSEPFAAMPTQGAWDLCLIIPIQALWQSHLQSFSNMEAKGNFYKCGDKLPRPHFLSWSPLSHPTPKFHLPQQFGCMQFAE